MDGRDTINTETPKASLVVAGATGFIGQALAPALSQDYHLIGLSRGPREDPGEYDEFRQADLFSLKDTENALAGADFAVYLVHSMLPSARLVQANFRDLDLVCADNFARAAKRAGVKQIVYLGGIVPDGPLSEHLASRVEVEHVLASTGVSVTVLRAGLVVGASGSSFQILLRLVKRLPMMLCPSWTATLTQPVCEKDVIETIAHFCRQSSTRHRTFDIACPQPLSYRELMQKTAAALGLKRLLIGVPLLTPALSRLWVSLTTGAPKALVRPLIASLRYPMVAHPSRLLDKRAFRTVDEMLALAVQDAKVESQKPRAFSSPNTRKSGQRDTVRSVQRMSLPVGRDAHWATEEYLRWLPKGLKGIIRIDKTDNTDIVFRIFKKGPILLKLSPRLHRSEPSRQVLRVTGGLLAKETVRGRLEFRQVLDGQTLIAAIHEFEPAMPWWIYRFTQALFHRWVMNRFARHLGQVGPEKANVAVDSASLG